MVESLLKTYSLGYAVHDIEEDSSYCNFFPVEKLPGYSGDINDSTPEISVTTDIHGKIDAIKIDKSVKILAKWYNNGDSNRLTPPNICKGETVMIYRYSDTDIYFWSTIYNELDLRKLEKATYVYSNKRSIAVKSALNKVYYWTVDTINKFIRLHTDASDGEYTTYDLEIDTKAGELTILDGRGNTIELISNKDRFHISVNKDSVLDIGRDSIENIKNNKKVKLSKLSITNDTAELISVLSSLVEANINDLGVGNHGADVPRTGGTIATYQAIKAKIDSFKI